jgi:hypothetical protein
LTPRLAVEEVAVMTPMRDASADLWRMSATELAEAIRSKQVSSREVIEAHLRRIEAVDPDVNAVPVVLGEQDERLYEHGFLSETVTMYRLRRSCRRAPPTDRDDLEP